jgi:hypothetical protein
MRSAVQITTQRHAVRDFLANLSGIGGSRGLDIEHLAYFFPEIEGDMRSPIAWARQSVRHLETQRLIENVEGRWRETTAGIVWRIVLEQTEAGKPSVPYDEIIQDWRLDRFTAKQVMQGISAAGGKHILHYLPEGRLVSLAVPIEPTLGT